MKRLVTLLAFLIYSTLTFAQLPGPVIGPAVAIPAGSFNCTQSPFPSPIGVGQSEPINVTFCFNYFNVGPVTLSFILVSGLCGPFPLYNSLNFTVYDSAGTNLITSGTIVPTANNNNLSILMPGTWYTICYTWTPNCAQFSACPLIYTSALPINLLFFNGYMEGDKTILKWATATETDVDKYIIYKSTDLQNYKEVGSIKVYNNSNSTRNYELVDDEKNTTVTYYKLTEVTVDNKFIDHSVVAVNPLESDEEKIQIFDIFGREVYSIKEGVFIIKKGGTRYKVIQVGLE